MNPATHRESRNSSRIQELIVNPKVLFTKLRPVDLTILWQIVADAIKIRKILRSARELDLGEVVGC